METWIEIGGLEVRSPVTAFTNLLLSVQCAVYWRRLRGTGDRRARYWSHFFLSMAVATLAGVPKHGLEHMLSADLYAWVLWVSSLGSAASVYFAQRATLVSRAGPESGRLPLALCRIEVAAFLAASLALGPEMWLVVVNTAVGLVPVIVVEARARGRGSVEAGWVVAGLATSLGTGAVYVVGVSLGPWFNHIDIAHVLMGVSFVLIVRGGREGVGAGAAEEVRRRTRREPLASLPRRAEGAV